ncbi:MAG: hypothetical protein GX907_03880 [Clostridiaceae bacterium]|nr:hypothetical protein [Clostridiaceae bacterium]
MSDPRIPLSNCLPTEIEYHNCLEQPFEVLGLYEPHSTGRFYRLPRYLFEDESINDGVKTNAKHSSGGRVRFATDSPWIVVAAEVAPKGIHSHTTLGGTSGIDVYVAPRGRVNRSYRVCCFAQPVSPDYPVAYPPDALPEGLVNIYYGEHPDPRINPVIQTCYYFATHDLHNEHEVELNLPNYSTLFQIYVGIQPGSRIFAPRPYTNRCPVLAYGSSIDQGCAASRPGNTWLSHIGRRLDIDTINLGFSGADRGEAALAHFIAEQKISLFVMNYEANIPSIEHLAQTHRPFYEIVRRAQPDLPIILVSMPRYPKVPDRSPQPRIDRNRTNRIIVDTYNYGLSQGDQNLYYVDGSTLYGGSDQDACIVDHIHPNDLGFLRMADRFESVIRQALGLYYN